MKFYYAILYGDIFTRCTGQQGYNIYMYMSCRKESLPRGKSGFNPRCRRHFLVFYLLLCFVNDVLLKENFVIRSVIKIIIKI